jgi:hypothetical protein
MNELLDQIEPAACFAFADKDIITVRICNESAGYTIFVRFSSFSSAGGCTNLIAIISYTADTFLSNENIASYSWQKK